MNEKSLCFKDYSAKGRRASLKEINNYQGNRGDDKWGIITGCRKKNQDCNCKNEYRMKIAFPLANRTFLVVGIVIVVMEIIAKRDYE